MKKGILFYMEKEKKDELKDVAYKLKKPVAEIVREATEEYISKFNTGPKNLKEAIMDLAGICGNNKVVYLRDKLNDELEERVKKITKTLKKK